MNHEMGKFIGWKFGVPVKVFFHNSTAPQIEGRLVNEDDLFFTILLDSKRVMSYSKDCLRYELIPHKYSRSPRYPVCVNSSYAAFCNSAGIMRNLDATGAKLEPYPAATLNIDGKVIELSAETVANLKKELGV